MRILYVTDGISPHVIGGMQTVSRSHIEFLNSAGHEVILVTSHVPDGEEVKVPARTIVLPWPTRSKSLRIYPWGYASELNAFSRSIPAIVRDVAPEVIYSEGPLVDAYLGCRSSGSAPVVFHPHGLEMFQHKGSFRENLKSFPLRSIITRHCRSADLVVSMGGRLTGLIQSIGTEFGRIEILPNSAPQAVGDLPERSPGGRLLFVGRNERRKGLGILLDAVASLEGISLDVVGVAAPTVGPVKGVSFHGPTKDRNVIRQYYLNSDFLVVPSYAEGMPTVILEAFAAGLPVIASDVGAVGELVRPGETGFLVMPGMADDLRDTIRQAAKLTQHEYQKMALNCLTLAKENYSPQRISGRFLEIIERAAALKNHRPQVS